MRTELQKTIEVEIAKVIWDGKYYPRISGTDWATEHRYAEAMKLGAEFPPIVIGYHKGKPYGLEGRHRCGAAHRVGKKTITAVVSDLPEKEWLAFAIEVNKKHGRCLTMQDRIAAADRLKRMGYPISRITTIVGISLDGLREALTRVVVNDKGEREVLKSSVAHLSGTGAAREQEAIQSQHAIANANQRRTLDEMLGLLRAKAFDLEAPGIADRLRSVRDKLIAMKLG